MEKKKKGFKISKNRQNNSLFTEPWGGKLSLSKAICQSKNGGGDIKGNKQTKKTVINFLCQISKLF